MVALSTNQ
jgi:hypothetical protein